MGWRGTSDGTCPRRSLVACPARKHPPRTDEYSVLALCVLGGEVGEGTRIEPSGQRGSTQHDCGWREQVERAAGSTTRLSQGEWIKQDSATCSEMMKKQVVSTAVPRVFAICEGAMAAMGGHAEARRSDSVEVGLEVRGRRVANLEVRDIRSGGRWPCLCWCCC
jgi:hypothetical protein